MGVLRASHHNIHYFVQRGMVAYAGPWTARVIRGNAIYKVLTIRSALGAETSNIEYHRENDIGN